MKKNGRRIAFCAVALVTIAAPADALCITPQEEGRWINTDPDTRGITRVELTFVCQDQVLNGQPYPPGPPWYIHAWGRCHPQDCDWREIGANETQGGYVYGVFEQGFARKHVWARMSQYRPGQLWIYIYVDFADPGRADYDAQYWFRRETTTIVDCGRNGSRSLFVANFDGDTVGSLPESCAPLHYGPPGACLEVDADANTVEVVSSTALGSQALKIGRGSTQHSVVRAVVGDIGTGAYTGGTYYINFRAQGAVMPQYLISGAALSVRSEAGRGATFLKVFDGLYHRLQGTDYLDLPGAYDASAAHAVHFALDLDDRTYSMCVDDQVLVENRSLHDGDFDALREIRFLLPRPVTEAFPAEFVVDDLRITKE